MNDDQPDDDTVVADLRAGLHALVKQVCERTPPHFLGDEKAIMFAVLTALSFSDPKFPAFVAGLPLHVQRQVYTYVPLGPLPLPDATIH